MSTERLNQSSNRIKESRRTMLETEELGVSILQDLHQQRQALLHADTTVCSFSFSFSISSNVFLMFYGIKRLLLLLQINVWITICLFNVLLDYWKLLFSPLISSLQSAITVDMLFMAHHPCSHFSPF